MSTRNEPAILLASSPGVGAALAVFLLAGTAAAARIEDPPEHGDRPAVFQAALEAHAGSVALVRVHPASFERGRRRRRGEVTQGSGWLVRRKGLLACAASLLGAVGKGGDRPGVGAGVTVLPPGGEKTVAAEVALVVEDLGLAFLRIPEGKAQKGFPDGPLRLEETDDVTVGERVFWIERLPLEQGSKAIVRSGIVAGRLPKPDRRIVVDAPIPAGAVVFSMRSRPVGVASAAPAVLEGAASAEGLGFVLPGGRSREAIQQAASAPSASAAGGRRDF